MNPGLRSNPSFTDVGVSFPYNFDAMRSWSHFLPNLNPGSEPPTAEKTRTRDSTSPSYTSIMLEGIPALAIDAESMPVLEAHAHRGEVTKSTAAIPAALRETERAELDETAYNARSATYTDPGLRSSAKPSYQRTRKRLDAQRKKAQMGPELGRTRNGARQMTQPLQSGSYQSFQTRPA
jgi:hypothetical protein